MTGFRGSWAAAVNTTRKLPLLAHTITRMVAEDPLLFSVQTARRLPKRLRNKLTPRATTKPSVGLAWAAFIADQPDQARNALRSLEENPQNHQTHENPHNSRVPSRLEAELRIQLGLQTTATASATTNARAAWADGKVEDEAFSSERIPPALADRFSGEERVHRIGSGIVLNSRGSSRDAFPRQAEPTTPEPSWGAQGADATISVLHLLTNSLPWTRSGYTYRSQAVLNAQQKAGIQVHAATRLAYPTLIGRPWAPPSDTVDGITYQRLEPRRLPRGTDQRLHLQAELFADLVAIHEPHVLQTTTNFHNALSVDAVSRATGLPWVYEMRGNMEQSWIARQPVERREELLSSQRYLRMRDRETEMAGRANHVVVLSSTQKSGLVDRGIEADKITVIPNSVDVDLLSYERDPIAAQQALGLPAGFWVGSVTAVVDYEGLPTLLRAVATLRGKGLPVMAAIVGDGVALPGLRTLATELGIEGAVVMPGRVLPEEALKWYAALDVFAIPRVSTEVTRTVTPMKGLQAMAMGVPLVVSDLPALVEVGASSGQGLVVPPDDSSALADTLMTLATDPDRRDRLSAAGRVAAADLTWQAAGERYMSIYRKLRIN